LCISTLLFFHAFATHLFYCVVFDLCNIVLATSAHLSTRTQLGANFCHALDPLQVVLLVLDSLSTATACVCMWDTLFSPAHCAAFIVAFDYVLFCDSIYSIHLGNLCVSLAPLPLVLSSSCLLSMAWGKGEASRTSVLCDLFKGSPTCWTSDWYLSRMFHHRCMILSFCQSVSLLDGGIAFECAVRGLSRRHGTHHRVSDDTLPHRARDELVTSS